MDILEKTVEAFGLKSQKKGIKQDYSHYDTRLRQLTNLLQSKLYKEVNHGPHSESPGEMLHLCS